MLRVNKYGKFYGTIFLRIETFMELERNNHYILEKYDSCRINETACFSQIMRIL